VANPKLPKAISPCLTCGRYEYTAPVLLHQRFSAFIGGSIDAGLHDQHRIAEAEEPVALPHRLAVSRKHALPAGKSAHQQQ